MVTYSKLRGPSPTLRVWTQRFKLYLLLLLCTVIGSAAFGQVDFRQSANNDAGYGLGNVHWLNSILQQSNSTYVEGMSSLQRVILLNVEPTSGNNHTLSFSFQTIKASAGSHAYDFLTSWEQAVTAANTIGQVAFEPDKVLYSNVNECGAEPASDPTGYRTACADVHPGGANYNFRDVDVPDNMPNTLGDNVQQRILAYEGEFGNRTIRIYGNAPISAGSLNFTGYTGNDLDANYTLSWTSSATTIVVEFATHLAVGMDPLNAGIGYGQGKGAGGISGGPYHVNLWQLDGASLGSQDNQIKAADILVPPSCTLPALPDACPGAAPVTINATVFNAVASTTYTWSFVGDPLGATFVGGTNAPITTATPTVQVNPGSVSGTVTIQLLVSTEGLTSTCTTTLTILTNVALTNLAPQTKCPGENATFSSTASGTGADGGDITWWKGATQIVDDNTNYDIVVSGQTSTLTIYNVDEADEGTYTAKIGGTGLCGTAEKSSTLTVDVNSALTALTPQTKCPGEDAVFTSTASGTGADGGDIRWYKGATQIVDDNVNYDIVVSGATSTLTIHNVDEADEGTYTAKIGGTGLCGSDEESATLTVVANPTGTANGGVITCQNTSVILTATDVSPAGTTLQWYGPASGGGVGPALSGNTPTVTQTGTYTLVLSEPVIGCQTTLTAIVSERFDAPLPPGISVTHPDCNVATGTITATSTTPNVTFTLTGPGGPYVNTTGIFPLLAPGTYGLTLSTNSNIPGCTFNVPLPITVNPQPPCDINCTYTQGYYGNKNGNSCSDGEAFESPIELMTDLLSSGDIVIGSLAGKWIRIPGGASANESAMIINSVMPGGGTATTLPAGTACNIVTGTCFDFNGSATTFLTKQGRINNVLLSQTIALSLNMRTNGGTLASIPIESGWLTTQDVSGCSTEAPVITCEQNASTIRSILMNQDVVAYLGAGATVADLLDLANAVLGGTLTPGIGGVPSYSAINSAVDAINNAFDQCRLFMDYFDTKQFCPETLLTTQRVASTEVSDLKIAAYPNPYNNTVSFNFTSPVSGKASLEVYDLVGRRLAVVFEGQVDGGMQKAVNYNVPSAQRVPMIYRLSVGGKSSFGKLLPGNTD